MEEPILRIRDLSFSYDGGRTNSGPVLSGINVEIREGERIAILGSNGAGKSTFFLCINGVLEADKGEIWYMGKKIGRKDQNILRKHVGIVFQEADNQIIASTVRGEVSFGPMNLRLPKEEVARRVTEALRILDLSEFGDRPPQYLSGGEKKRVTIADILAMESEVILFDEPASSLDPQNRENFERILENLWKMGKTLLISTHDVDFAYRFAGRILVFGEGRILADGSPEEIFADEELLTRANLKKPMLLEVYQMLAARGILQTGPPPKSLEALGEMAASGKSMKLNED